MGAGGSVGRGLAKVWRRGGQGRGEEFVGIVAGSSLSLALSWLVVDYHGWLAGGVVTATHHVHHWFLSLVLPLPDYSQALADSVTLRVGLCYLYLLFGYLGISSQLALTLDLLFLANLPTILIYRLLANLYQLLLKCASILK